MADSVYLLWHVHHVASREGVVCHFDNPDDFWADEQEGDDVKLLGAYSCEEKALARIETAARLEGFAGEPRCFHIGRYELDEDHWTEGFVTADPPSH